MNECAKIRNDVATFQRETFDRSFANWSAGFREEVAARDNQTGEVSIGGFDGRTRPTRAPAGNASRSWIPRT